MASEQDATVVRVETDDGLVGWGEQAVFTPSLLPAHGGGTRAALALLAPAVLGADPRQVEMVHARMDAALKGHAYAKAALDIACWDLLGKATGLRVADLLGGAWQEEIPLYTGIGIAAPDAMRARCEEAVTAGYRHVQVKVGTGWREDVARVEACLEPLAGAELVIVDANGGWPRAQAVRALAALDAYDVHIEQPCATLDQCAAVRPRSRRPFVLDESLASVADIESARGIADAVRLKLSQFGGITPLRRARDAAALWGLAMTIEDSGGSGIVTAATTHLACSVPPHLLLSGFLAGDMVAERIAPGAPTAVDGRARLPEGPGLGVEPDVAVLGEPLVSFA